MSVPVHVSDLPEELERYGASGHLCTVGDDGRPHVVAVTPTWDGDRLTSPAGRRTLENAAARPAVALLWSPPGPGAYSLIVDGDAVVAPPSDGDDGRIWVRPTSVIRHRPAPPPAPARRPAPDAEPT
jgi:hypothetical protein